MKPMQIFVIICSLHEHSSTLLPVDNLELFREKYGGNLHSAMLDIVKGFPTNELTVVFDIHTDYALLTTLFTSLSAHSTSLTLFNVTSVENQDKYFSYVDGTVENHLRCHTVYFVSEKMAEHILIELNENNFIRRTLVYMFYWGAKELSRHFVRAMNEAMKLIVITNPRDDAYRIYFNQATSHRRHHLSIVNWWINGRKLFNHPTVPLAVNTYKNFKGRLIYVPVIDKPPWHFVRYTNDSTEVLGGRDDKLLHLLSQRLNFRYEYFDPPHRIQGSSFSANGTFEGVLGLVWKREVEFFLGDVALTLERSRAVDFSFFTLADSGAFVTHAPDKLNEALALVRPFHWKVWPAIVITFCLAGPILYFLIVIPNMWRPRFLIKSHSNLFFDCLWFTTSLFLRQSEKEPSKSHKSRFFIILLSIAATYVIGDMYSANLTSLLAKPGKEKSINNLLQLEEAMQSKGVKLYVEKHSSTYSLLENGTGIYGRLWNLMNQKQASFVVNSVEEGVKMVKDFGNVAVIAGRETLFFDIQRFGPTNFHLSEKVNTGYSAIAFQLGCPYLENFNRILMAVFEAGILTKMTENEYEKLGKQQLLLDKDIDKSLLPATAEENIRATKATEENEKLKPINIKMLQGAFYLLFIGHLTAGIALNLEFLYKKHFTIYRKEENMRFKGLQKLKSKIRQCIIGCIRKIKIKVRIAFNDAIISTFEYTE